MSAPWPHKKGGAMNKAEYLAKQGCAVASIHRMVKFEFGWCPSENYLRELVAAEAKRRERFKRGAYTK